MKRRDLSGQRFGNLLVIEPADFKTKKHIFTQVSSRDTF